MFWIGENGLLACRRSHGNNHNLAQIFCCAIATWIVSETTGTIDIFYVKIWFEHTNFEKMFIKETIQITS